MDLAVGVAVYFAMFILVMIVSEKHSFFTFILLPLWTLVWIVIFSQSFATMKRKINKKASRSLLMGRISC